MKKTPMTDDSFPRFSEEDTIFNSEEDSAVQHNANGDVFIL